MGRLYGYNDNRGEGIHIKIEGSDYHVAVVPFPSSRVGGLCTVNDDCTDTIIINADLPVERWAEVLQHELCHLDHDDLYHGDVLAAEARAKAAEKKEGPVTVGCDRA